MVVRWIPCIRRRNGAVADVTSGEGDYMNGGISPLLAGELAKGAFDHGMEAYGVDILERLWTLSQRDGGYLHDTC